MVIPLVAPRRECLQLLQYWRNFYDRRPQNGKDFVKEDTSLPLSVQ